MTTPAMGGDRLLPEPDPIAREYLLLGLRLGQHIPGLVDGYFGPADLKAQVDMEQLRTPSRLTADAAALRERVAAEVRPGAPQRADWLTAQAVALETQARALAGEALPYLDHVERCFDFRPQRRPDEAFRKAAATLDALLPGAGTVGERLAALDRNLTVPVDRVPDVANRLVERFRSRAAAAFGLPSGERLRIALVRDQPWSGYNWYEGGLRSRVDLNLDLPIRAPDLVHVIAHETYPGHHLEHAWKEADLVVAQGRLEASILLINTPECLISEGLADLGARLVAGPDVAAGILADVLAWAGLAPPTSTENLIEIAALRRGLGAIAVNAALMRHEELLPHEAVRDYLVTVGLMAPERAEKRLSFIEHPLWRTYVFVYSEGEALLRTWLERAPTDEQPARFGRLLHEQLTPSAVQLDVASSAA
ncbi:MAG: hypothetical protein FJ038_07305 [Chloroflexi bacterium]|nr:hypothetical protein [Chloroflexota bacterium]